MKNGKLSEYDARQIDLIKQRISEFERGEISISRFLDDVDALLGCLETIDEQWKSAFKSEWGTFEEVYAVSLYRDQKELPLESLDLLKDAVRNMKRLLAEFQSRMNSGKDRGSL